YTVVVSATDVEGTAGSDTFTWNVIGPAIFSLSQTSAVEGSGSFALGISGTDFQSGNTTVTISGSATAHLGSVALIPINVTGSTSMTVNVPNSIIQQDGPLSITVTVPDASGVPTNLVTSGAVSFGITAPPFVALSYPGAPFT